MFTVPIEAPSTAATRPRISPVRRRLLIGSLLMVAFVAIVLFVTRAWQQTVRREAYLPDLELMARRAPFDGPLLALLGGRQAQAGDFATASATLQRAVAAGETQADVWKTWAAATAASGKSVEALSVLRLGLNKLSSAAERAQLQEALDRAQRLYGDSSAPAMAHAISPEGLDPIVSRYTGGSFLNGFSAWWGEHHLAESGVATRESHVKAAPNDANAQRWWGLALQRNRRLPLAEIALRQAVTLAPQDPDAHLALADLLKQMGASGKAGLEYEACLHLRHNSLPALLGLGEVALEKSLIALSVSVFQKATALAPNSVDAFIGLGRAYYSTHIQLGQAVSAFQQAEHLAPARTDYFPDYFRALRMTFQYEKAEALIRRRLQSAPEEAQSHFLLAHPHDASRRHRRGSQMAYELRLRSRSAGATRTPRRNPPRAKKTTRKLRPVPAVKVCCTPACYPVGERHHANAAATGKKERNHAPQGNL